MQQALAQTERQQERLLSAYLAEVIDLQMNGTTRSFGTEPRNRPGSALR
jgi:hypothetical protein